MFSQVSIKMGVSQQHYNVHKSVQFNYHVYSYIYIYSCNLFIVFNNVFCIIPFMEFPLKWEFQNNIMIYIIMSYYEEILYNKKFYSIVFEGEVQ
jgi:hypothetical protein